MYVKLGRGHLLAIGIEHTETEETAVVVEVAERHGMKSLAESLLADEFAGILLTVIIDDHDVVDNDIRAVITEEGEGVDAVFGELHVTGGNETDVALHPDRDADVFALILGTDGGILDKTAVTAGKFMPNCAETWLKGRGRR